MVINVGLGSSESKANSPSAATDADDADRGAIEADRGRNVLQDDTEEAQESSHGPVGGGADVLTAADRASVAARGALRDRSGGRKGGEDSGGIDGDLGEHGGW